MGYIISFYQESVSHQIYLSYKTDIFYSSIPLFLQINKVGSETVVFCWWGVQDDLVSISDLIM